jgi:Family of unknown function (DUF5681)
MMSSDDPTDDDGGGGGYGHPPRKARYTKGQSGNLNGRPRGRRREAPYEAVLGRMMTIREDGVESSVSAEQAFPLLLLKRGLEGDGAITRATLTAIENTAKRRPIQWDPIVITRIIVNPGSVTHAAELLRMAKKLDPYRETARMALEPWLIEAALGRLDRKLNPAEQQTIVKATRTPNKVRWPDWWSEFP